jgi:hypothetical protein
VHSNRHPTQRRYRQIAPYRYWHADQWYEALLYIAPDLKREDFDRMWDEHQRRLWQERDQRHEDNP